MVRDAGSFGTLVTSGFWQTGDTHDRFRSFFRPLVSASYAADYALWGLRPIGFRVTNLLLHLMCCLLIFRLALGEGLDARAAWVGAALFAVHPVHVESVAWISGRTDLLCALLMLAAFLAHRTANEGRSRRFWGLASLGLFLMALFAKEMAATLPALIAADRAMATRRPGPRFRSAALACLPYLAVLGLYLVARHIALGREADPLYRLDTLSHAATAIFVLARYATLLLLPIGLDAHYPYRPIETLASPLVVISALMMAVIAWGGWRAWRRSATAGFWMTWILISILPVLAFGSFGDVLLADRFLYIPSVGLALLAARILSPELAPGAARLRRGLVVSGVACVLAAMAIPSAQRAAMWTDDLTLFSRMLRTSPDSGMVRCNLGLAYYHRGEYDRSIQEFEKAILLAPGYAMAHNNLAAALEREGRLHESLEQYELALRTAPGLLESLINRSNLLVRLDETKKGLDMLRVIVVAHPRYPPALYAYADALDRSGRRDEALHWLRRAIDVDSSYPNAHYMLGKILAERGDRERAAEEMRRFLLLWPEEGVWSDAARHVIAMAESTGGSLKPPGVDPAARPQ